MRRTLTALFTLVSLAGCDSYIGTSEHEARQELSRFTGWVHAKADSQDEVIRDIGTVKTGRLAQGDEASIPLDVTGAHRANVIAACDSKCSDLDLRVVTEDGRLINLDDDEDDTPRVYINERKTNKLVLKIRMPKCSASSCSYAVRQMEYEDYAGAYGTCFAVSPNGLLMTSFHVIDGASKINVVFPDGRSGEAELFRGSNDTDIALLKTKLPTPTWLPLATNSEIAIGTPAFTVGFPSPQLLGSEVKLNEGSVSSLSGLEESTLLQISIPIQGGNSGGPVIDHSGRVLGIVEGIVEKDSDGETMQLTNFARHAQVAALLLPLPTTKLPMPKIKSRQEAIAHALKAVCQIKTE